ncbi:hypothetical protein Anapl_05375 [Anas platyrhynchos]|uniref:Uncharacterized protein n=1 Tax=Anas platyrhynchos TaxID=8839 RepID=R0LP34_ANAPL|nr:hypothetical protein Anapl_05375 [Anas platyrhynchos]
MRRPKVSSAAGGWPCRRQLLAGAAAVSKSSLSCLQGLMVQFLLFERGEEMTFTQLSEEQQETLVVRSSGHFPPPRIRHSEMVLTDCQGLAATNILAKTAIERWNWSWDLGRLKTTAEKTMQVVPKGSTAHVQLGAQEQRPQGVHTACTDLTALHWLLTCSLSLFPMSPSCVSWVMGSPAASLGSLVLEKENNKCLGTKETPADFQGSAARQQWVQAQLLVQAEVETSDKPRCTPLTYKHVHETWLNNTGTFTPKESRAFQKKKKNQPKKQNHTAGAGSEVKRSQGIRTGFGSGLGKVTETNLALPIMPVGFCVLCTAGPTSYASSWAVVPAVSTHVNERALHDWVQAASGASQGIGGFGASCRQEAAAELLCVICRNFAVLSVEN